MDEAVVQYNESPIKNGFFNSDPFKRKRKLILVLKTGIAGLQFNVDLDTVEGKKLLDSLIPGTELKLYRDADNEFDEWAIAVETCGQEALGHITRFKNETIARLMDHGKKFVAFVDEKTEDEDEYEERNIRRKRAPTENYELPFSVYMEE